MKYYIIAGEASGDLHASNLMRQIKLNDPQANFRFWGGDLMQAQGGAMVTHYKDMAFMGFVEVARHLNQILKNLKFCKTDILEYRPDILILVDFPGFNLRIAEFAKQQGIKTCYYIAPKVWAWNQSRVKKIRKSVDKLLCILPFEIEFFKKHEVDIEYVGNPLLDAVAAHQPNPLFLESNGLTQKPIIALLPGSRKMEIAKLLPVMVQLSKKHTNYQFVIAGAPAIDKSYYEHYMQGHHIPLVFGQTYDLLQHATAAVVASGTATLETALFKVPQLVIYKMNAITYHIAKRLVKISYISLVNLIMDKQVVKEFIQEDCNVRDLDRELSEILKKEAHYASIMTDYAALRSKMGEVGASAQAAKVIQEFLNSQKK